MKESKRPTRKTQKKNVSLRDIAEKVIGIFKKPTDPPDSDKPTLKKPASVLQAKRPESDKIGPAKKTALVEARPESDPADDGNPSSSASQAVNPITGFFYTNDKNLEQLDDPYLIAQIRVKYPEFALSTNDEAKSRRIIIKMLENSPFMKNFLEKYNLTILDFFKFIYRVDSQIFNTLFVKRIQRVLKNRKYAAMKKHVYNFTGKKRRRRKTKQQV